MSARFEVVRSDADQNGKEWHGRFRVNGRIVWHTPRLSRKIGVERAIESVAGPIRRSVFAEWPEVAPLTPARSDLPTEVRYVDERTDQP